MQDHPFLRKTRHFSVRAKSVPLLFLEIYPRISSVLHKLDKRDKSKTQDPIFQESSQTVIHKRKVEEYLKIV